MVRRLHLLIAALVATFVLSVLAVAPAAADEACSKLARRAGLCASGTVESGRAVTLRGEKTQQTHTSRESIQSEKQGQNIPVAKARSLSSTEIHALLDEVCIGDGTCGPTRGDAGLNPLIALPEPAEPEPAEDDDPAPGAPPRVVTITDVARFLPAVAGLHAEPDGWAVVGVPANFWVDVQPVTVDGSLLGQTAQVRFTPRAYRWDYGDGTTRATSSPGACWADLDQEELTDTPTSHVYEARQDLRASVAVVYSAEYRVGDGGWTAVAGAVTGTAPPMRVLVVHERTVLTTGG